MLEMMEHIGVLPESTPRVQWVARPLVFRVPEFTLFFQKNCLLALEEIKQLKPFRALKVRKRRETGPIKNGRHLCLP